jgi:hypothetical protein
VLADELGRSEAFEAHRTKERIIWLTNEHAESLPKRSMDLVVSIPKANLTRAPWISSYRFQRPTSRG